MMGYKRVVVEVTDVDEPGVVTLSSLQPQVGADLTATLVDPEVPSPTADSNDLTWKWEKVPGQVLLGANRWCRNRKHVWSRC